MGFCLGRLFFRGCILVGQGATEG